MSRIPKVLCACFVLSSGITWAATMQCKIERLISGRGEAERYAELPAAEGVVSCTATTRADGTEDSVVSFTSKSAQAGCFLLTVRAKIPFGDTTFWNGYLNQINGGEEEGEGIGAFFPAIAALGKEKSFILGINPRCTAPRVQGAQEGDCLALAFPLYLDPGETVQFQLTTATCKARYRWHDVVERWYELFPKEFATADSLHPAAASAGCSYLYWKPETLGVKTDADRAERLKKNYGKYGCWDWCYKPFVRGGDWAISDEYTVGWSKFKTPGSVEAKRRLTRNRMAAAEALNVAPMWYINVCWTETELWQKHFPGILMSEKPKIGKCWQQSTVRTVYCGGDTAYNKFYREGLKNVPLKFPQAKGYAWDSCFAIHKIPETHEGFAGTRPRGHEKGVPFAQEGIGVASLLDYAHEQFSGPHRMANALNYKLVAPWFVASRGDSGLYEGTPMTRPERFWRLESMRCRFGPKKYITWHKGCNIKVVDSWAHIKDLPEAERDDAHRQIMDDNLFMSYYWGTLPPPILRSENQERWTSAVPELVELIALGWHPSPAADAPKDILLARYGDGKETRIAVINATFKAREVTLTFPKEYWKDAEFGTTCQVTVPARDIVILAPGQAPRAAKIAPYVPVKKVFEPTLFHWLNRSKIL